MHIILVSDRLTKTRSVTLTTRHLAGAAMALVALVLALSSGLLYVTIRHAAEIKLPLMESLIMAAQEQRARQTETFLRQNLNAMAVKLGEMQAQLMRLDALGERLVALSGLKASEFRFNEVPGRGGAAPAGSQAKNMSLEEFNQQLDQVMRRMENRTDTLGIMESQLFDAKVKRKLMPTIPPVETSWSASSFGWRIDPITGMQAMHEGVDFMADTGTPIFAAAGGIVVAAEYHHQYGNMVEVDHGNDFITRYAHASRIMVKVGDVVQRGRKIAEVGSTGRTTGPHLHFEVRYKGIAQNPARFLQASR